MTNGKSEKPRTTIVHDSDQNQTRPIRPTERFKSLTAAYRSGRYVVPNDETSRIRSSFVNDILRTPNGGLPTFEYGVDPINTILALKKDRKWRSSNVNAIKICGLWPKYYPTSRYDWVLFIELGRYKWLAVTGKHEDVLLLWAGLPADMGYVGPERISKRHAWRGVVGGHYARVQDFVSWICAG